MQIEGRFIHAAELGKPGLRKAPEAFNSVDVALALSKLILPMVDSEMLFKAEVNEPIIASPSIGMDDAFKADTTPNYCLQRCFSAIGDDLCIDLPLAFEDAEDNRFSESSPASFALNSSSAEEAFIDFNLSVER